MMLVHKHPVLPLAHAHRRNPSAPPAVIVQSTRTPGLLSLSKPPRSSPPQQRQLHAHQRHQKAVSRPKLASPVAAAEKPTSAFAQLADSAFSNSKLPSSAAPSSPPSQPRGRAHAKHFKEKPIDNSRILTRSSSNNSLRNRPARQPSPPMLPPAKTSQAEGLLARLSHSANLFDPFLDDTSSHNPPPTLYHKPSGKLARRRQPSSPSPAASQAIPVPPLTTRTHALNISRSDPALSHMPNGQPRRRSSTAGLITFDVFPICDDMTDAGDLSDHESSLPVTPTRPKAQNSFKDGPRTAPAMGFFPSLTKPPSSAPQQKTREGGRKHKRSPSEGIFNMSSDEDSSTGWNPNVAALFQLTSGTKASTRAYTTPHKLPAPVTPKFVRDLPSAAVQAKERQHEKEAAEKVAGYFASSSFQNSPSPEELPDPLFV